MKKISLALIFCFLISLPAFAVCKIDETITGAACSIQKEDSKKVFNKKKMQKTKSDNHKIFLKFKNNKK